MAMRRLLGSFLPALLLVTALGACGGDDSGGVAKDPETASSTGSPSTSQTAQPDEGAVDFTLVDLITMTAAGGSVSPTAVPMDDAAAAQAFASQFTAGDLADRVEDTVANTDVPDGQAMYAAVVSIGCDTPTDVAVVASDDGLVITPLKVADPKPECFAAMTTVALVLVSASAVG